MLIDGKFYTFAESPFSSWAPAFPVGYYLYVATSSPRSAAFWG